MKNRKTVVGRLILGGLAATLFVLPAANSQEITNSTFDDGPNVTSFAAPQAAQPSAEAAPAAASVPSANQAASAETSASGQHAALIDSPWVTAAMTAVLLVFIALSAIGESQGGRRRSSFPTRYPSSRGA